MEQLSMAKRIALNVLREPTINPRFAECAHCGKMNQLVHPYRVNERGNIIEYLEKIWVQPSHDCAAELDMVVPHFEGENYREYYEEGL